MRNRDICTAPHLIPRLWRLVLLAVDCPILQNCILQPEGSHMDKPFLSWRLDNHAQSASALGPGRSPVLMDGQWTFLTVFTCPEFSGLSLFSITAPITLRGSTLLVWPCFAFLLWPSSHRRLEFQQTNIPGVPRALGLLHVDAKTVRLRKLEHGHLSVSLTQDVGDMGILMD